MSRKRSVHQSSRNILESNIFRAMLALFGENQKYFVASI